MDMKEIMKKITYLFFTGLRYKIEGMKAIELVDYEEKNAFSFVMKYFPRKMGRKLTGNEEDQLKNMSVKDFLEEGLLYQETDEMNEIGVMKKVKRIAKKIDRVMQNNEVEIAIGFDDGFVSIGVEKDEKEKKHILNNQIRDLIKKGGQMIVREKTNMRYKEKNGERDVHRLYGIFFSEGKYYIASKEDMKKAYDGLTDNEIKEVKEVYATL